MRASGDDTSPNRSEAAFHATVAAVISSAERGGALEHHQGMLEGRVEGHGDLARAQRQLGADQRRVGTRR